MIHGDYLAIAALASILTAIPLFLMALLVGSNHTQRQTPPSKAAAQPPEPWEPAFIDGYGQDDNEEGEDETAHCWK